MAATLYIVPTPVGNLGDMTPRAIDVLKNVAIILAEDTRTSMPLLKHFGIGTKVESHHKYNEHKSVEAVADLIDAGNDVALISDAGTPGISDPGFLLVRECAARGIHITTLPGATAFVPALVSSGLACDRFIFEGFLPQAKGRATRIAQIAENALTTIIYESPKRLAKTLRQLSEICGPDRRASVSREISKIYENTQRGTLQQLAEYYEMNPPKGEIVIIVAGKNDLKPEKVHKNKYRDL